MVELQVPKQCIPRLCSADIGFRNLNAGSIRQFDCCDLSFLVKRNYQKAIEGRQIISCSYITEYQRDERCKKRVDFWKLS
jgi:hypothetical protein